MNHLSFVLNEEKKLNILRWHISPRIVKQMTIAQKSVIWSCVLVIIHMCMKGKSTCPTGEIERSRNAYSLSRGEPNKKKQHEIKQNSRWFSSHWHAQSPPSCVCMCFCVNTLIQIIFLSFTRSWFPKIKAVPECKHHKNPNWKWNICSVSRPKCMALYTEHDFDILCKRSIVFVTQLCCDRLQIHSQFENDFQISVWRFLIWHNSRDYRSMSMLFFRFYFIFCF